MLVFQYYDFQSQNVKRGILQTLALLHHRRPEMKTVTGVTYIQLQSSYIHLPIIAYSSTVTTTDGFDAILKSERNESSITTTVHSKTISVHGRNSISSGNDIKPQ